MGDNVADTELDLAGAPLIIAEQYNDAFSDTLLTAKAYRENVWRTIPAAATGNDDIVTQPVGFIASQPQLRHFDARRQGIRDASLREVRNVVKLAVAESTLASREKVAAAKQAIDDEEAALALAKSKRADAELTMQKAARESDKAAFAAASAVAANERGSAEYSEMRLGVLRGEFAKLKADYERAKASAEGSFVVKMVERVRRRRQELLDERLRDFLDTEGELTALDCIIHNFGR